MKKLPIGIQTFRKIIEENFLYIDKTQEIYNLITGDSQYHLLTRPRRFGKSLLISTLQELFAGNKQLFEGLWIHDKIDWQPHPVIHIDFSTLNYKTPDRLEETLDRMMLKIADTYGVTLDPKHYYNEKFRELIEKLSEQRQVVILIDEYDKPIIDKISDQSLALANRDALREFYSVIKASDRHITFAFITGVSKFSKVSVFSGLNNLRDITLIDRLVASIEANDIDTFFSTLQSIIASIPYNITIPDREAYYHTIIYLILKLIGIDIQAEIQTNQGRIDAIIQTDSHNYIMEFKMGTAEEALRQIKEKQYHHPFQTSPNPTILIGAGFDPQARNISAYLTESL